MGEVCRRRFLIASGSLLAAPLCAEAQSARKTNRVAFILTTSPIAEMAGPEPAHPSTRAFVDEMRTLGYVEGANLVLERRSAEGRRDKYPEIVAELVRRKTDVIVSAGGGALIRRAKEVTSTVPIVMLGSSQAVEFGLAASLARPGGNVTGLVAVTGPENEAKRLELLKEAIPRISRVAYLATNAAWNDPISEAVRRGALALGLELLHVEHLTQDLEKTFGAITRLRPDALFASLGPETFGQREQIIRFALANRLPGSYPFRELTEAGGVMSYGVDARDLGRGAARYVDKILKGAKPGDLPIEQPTKFELVINLKTAKALGIAIPESVLLRADQVIE